MEIFCCVSCRVFVCCYYVLSTEGGRGRVKDIGGLGGGEGYNEKWILQF